MKSICQLDDYQGLRERHHGFSPNHLALVNSLPELHNLSPQGSVTVDLPPALVALLHRVHRFHEHKNRFLMET